MGKHGLLELQNLVSYEFWNKTDNAGCDSVPLLTWHEKDARLLPPIPVSLTVYSKQ